uniref:G protein alpha subunit n=1 Tax=Globodera pallida TaxID=36090 RepID=A0A183CS11_GLOPA
MRLFRLPNEAFEHFHLAALVISFFDQIERIAKKDYRPTNMDILLTRVPTTGVVKLLFTLRNIDFNVYDVGGQRSERRKWIHFFDD